jgi:hypothetical protein
LNGGRLYKKARCTAYRSISEEEAADDVAAIRKSGIVTAKSAARGAAEVCCQTGADGTLEYAALLWILAPGGDICERVAQNAHRSELGGPATCVVLLGQVSRQPVGCSDRRDV